MVKERIDEPKGFGESEQIQNNPTQRMHAVFVSK
jgi:hypothetical protein